jgi:gliding motility-associated-like protein
MKYLFLLVSLLLYNLNSQAQCVLINEVMINPNNACDGACVPNTAEWIELFNTCTTPVDLSCYVITDGDFTITLPSGSSIPANGYFVIGSNNSGGLLDINISSCGCTSGPATEIGILSNTAEQLILVNSAGVQQDAIYWGAGQFPMNITSMTLGACAPININKPNNTGFALVPNSTDGCSIGRTCDASTTWQLKCGSNISKGATNGLMGIPAFTASNTSVCPGDCISFTDNSLGNPLTWFWTFSGAATGNSNSQNPSSVCYNNTGNFTVTLQITNTCGTFTNTQTGYIQVGAGATPNITANGPLNFCAGNSVTLSTNAVGTYQWQQNGVNISGATNSTLVVTQSGDYSVSVGSGSCAGVSNTLQVNVTPATIAIINSLSSTTICNGETVILESVNTADSYQWLLNGTAIAGETNQQLTVSTAGAYSLQVSSANGCTAVSTPTTVTVLTTTVPTIISTNGQYSFCLGQSLNLEATPGLANYQWYLNNNIIAGATSASYTVTQTGSYTVATVSANGCNTSSAPSIINLLPLPTALVSPEGPILICNAVPALLQATTGAAAYQWYDDNGIISGSNTSTYLAAQTGNYYVNITNTNGCSANSNTVIVSFNTGITVSIYNPNPSPCMGDIVFLSTTQNYNQIDWSTGENGIQIGVTQSGKYSVTVVNSGGCTAKDEVDITFLPKPNVEAGADVSSDCVNGIMLHGTGDGIPVWEPALGLSNDNTFDVNAAPVNTTTYYLTVDNGTCKATDSLVVSAECSSVYVPSAFTPNNDGINDVFKAIGLDLKDFKLVIYNRWGERIFQSQDINIGWDGTYRGNPSPFGMYVWELEANDKNGNAMLNDMQRRGVVNLVR